MKYLFFKNPYLKIFHFKELLLIALSHLVPYMAGIRGCEAIFEGTPRLEHILDPSGTCNLSPLMMLLLLLMLSANP